MKGRKLCQEMSTIIVSVIAGPVLRWSPSEHRTSLQASENIHVGQTARPLLHHTTDRSVAVRLTLNLLSLRSVQQAIVNVLAASRLMLRTNYELSVPLTFQVCNIHHIRLHSLF